MAARKPAPRTASLIPVERIERRIFLIRGHKVMLDSDLSALYQVETFNLNKAVKRNLDRFPDDFMFQLTEQEWKALTFQTGISNDGRGGRRHLPYVFTEHGVAMLSSVLRSKRAVQVNILVIRAFVHLRDLLATHKDLARAVGHLRAEQQRQSRKIDSVIAVVNKLLEPPHKDPKRRIGF